MHPGFWRRFQALSEIAPALASPEPSLFDRLAAHLPPDGDVVAHYRHALRRAAAIGDGWFIPMGFEFAARMPFDAARATPADLDRARTEAPADLSADIASANALIDRLAALRLVGPPRAITTDAEPATALLRIDTRDVRVARRAELVVINPDVAHPTTLPVPVAPLPPQSGAAFGYPEPIGGACSGPIFSEPLAPGEVRVVTYSRLDDIVGAAPAGPVERRPMEAARIAIEALSPTVPDGDYAVKRVVGEEVTVSADIVADGHEVLAASVLWRAADEAAWRQTPMRLVENDRWQGRFTPSRIGPHHFTVEAWLDHLGHVSSRSSRETRSRPALGTGDRGRAAHHRGRPATRHR